MANNIKSLRRVRLKIPFFVDVIFVADPEQIRRIETSGAVDRLNTYGTESMPFWMKTFFGATRFYDSKRDLWFLSLESERKPETRDRRACLQARVDQWYTPEDVETIADLLEAKADDETLAHAIAQVVNRRFFGQDLPRSITRAASYTLQEFKETMVPWRYFRARAAQKRIMAYCEKTLRGKAHLVDIGHNIGETVQTTAVALRRLYANLDTPVETIFTRHALTSVVPRIATKATRFNGLLLLPTVPRRTVLIYQIEKAATQSCDIRFTFGTGTDERTCVFKDFFIAFMEDLQATLRAGAPKKPAIP
jgi:hypothetical protein